MSFRLGAKVATVAGWKSIEDVAVGEEVLTHAGRAMPVTAKRESSGVGPMVGFVSSGPYLGMTIASAFQRVLTPTGDWIPLAELDLTSTVAGAHSLNVEGPVQYAAHPFPYSRTATLSIGYLAERGCLDGGWKVENLTAYKRFDAAEGSVYSLTVAEDCSYVVGAILAAC